MSISLKCDWRNLEEAKKIVFKSRLSGEPIHFGFVPKWERRKFVQFCKDQKLVIPFINTKGKPGFSKEVYRAVNTFTFEITWSPYHILGWVFEWIADLTGFRKRMLIPGIHYADKITQTIGPRNSAYGPNFNWMWVGKDKMR